MPGAPAAVAPGVTSGGGARCPRLVQLDRVVYVLGGLCLTPLLALAWVRSSPPNLQRLFWLLAPIWLVWVLLTERLEQGATLLALFALLFVPMTLAGIEHAIATRSVEGGKVP